MSWRRYDRYDYFYPRFPKSVPRKAKGGIKAQSKQGAFGASWWAKRWIGVLESFNIGARLGRGRSYARSGQVLDINITTGKITAKVQGSRPQPYKVDIAVKTLSKADASKLANALSQQAIFAAKLLAGEMPQEIEEVFKNAGLSLFPARLEDLDTDCSCPDWSNPCKHIAAVYYLVGEEFDRDPFLIFKLRGLNRDELVSVLGRESGRKAAHETEAAAPPDQAVAEALDPASPAFWTGAELPAGWLGEVRPPPVGAALPKRLGSFPFWRAELKFLEAIELRYKQASDRGLAVVLGERGTGAG